MKIIILGLLLAGSSLSAEYCATGKFLGNVCNSYILFESCKNIKIDAVRDKKNDLFEMKKCWNEVDEYKRIKDREICWLYTKTRGANILGYAVDKVVYPDFLHKNDKGGYEQLKPDYIVFDCKKK